MKKAEAIYELLEMIRTSLFKMTMYTEFERKVHYKISIGEILSAEDLSNMFFDLARFYYGENCHIDNEVKYE